MLKTPILPSLVPDIINIGKTLNTRNILYQLILEKLRNKKATKGDQQMTESGKKGGKKKQGRD